MCAGSKAGLGVLLSLLLSVMVFEAVVDDDGAAALLAGGSGIPTWPVCSLRPVVDSEE